jgi:hypothetical protein
MQDPTQSIDTTNLMSGLGIDTGLLGTIMTVGTVVSILLTILIILYFVRNSAHRKKSENAMIEMAKGIQDIKTLLEKQSAEKPPVQPAEHTDNPPDESRNLS